MYLYLCAFVYGSIKLSILFQSSIGNPLCRTWASDSMSETVCEEKYKESSFRNNTYTLTYVGLFINLYRDTKLRVISIVNN